MTGPRGEETGRRGVGLVGHARGSVAAGDAPPSGQKGKSSRQGKRQRVNAARWAKSQGSNVEAARERRQRRLAGESG
jgi:hypothetical protein